MVALLDSSILAYVRTHPTHLGVSHSPAACAWVAYHAAFPTGSFGEVSLQPPDPYP